MIPLDLVQHYFNDNDQAMRDLLTWFLNQIMQSEATQQAGASHYERTETRGLHRNGYKDRSLKTRYGQVALSKPQFREKPFETQLFGKYARVEKALVNAIAESYLQGVSTRRVQEIVAHLGVEQLSPSSVSRIAQDLDENVKKFLNRPIENEYPYIFVDASYFKVREDTRYISKAVLSVAGVRKDGFREVLGSKCTDCENEAFWTSLFEDLKERGLSGVKLVVSDGHEGIKKAVSDCFLGSSWQMCTVHFIRAVLRNLPRKKQKMYAEKLRESLENPEELQKIADELNEQKHRKSANTIERFLPGIMNYKSFPKAHWKRIRTTNMVERVHKEIKRRTKVVGAFPNDDSLMRLVGSILFDINEEWITGRKYLSMDEE